MASGPPALIRGGREADDDAGPLSHARLRETFAELGLETDAIDPVLATLAPDAGQDAEAVAAALCAALAEPLRARIAARAPLPEHASTSDPAWFPLPAPARPGPRARTRRHRALPRLVRWLLAHGARFPSVALVVTPDGSARVRAIAPIPAGGELLFIPHAAFITPRTDLPEHMALAARLLEEGEDPASPWRPYLDALPLEPPDLPLFYPPTSLALLRGSLCLWRLAAQRRGLAAEYCTLVDHHPALRRFGFSQYVAARTTVTSRVFALGAAQTLVPMADLLDHAVACEASWSHDEARGGVVMHATTDIAPGTEVHDSYGAKCNSRFLVSYGFCLPDNPDNHAALFLPPPRHDPRVDLLARLLWRHPIGSVRRLEVTSRYRDPATRRLFSYLRLACASDDEYTAIAAHGRLQRGEIGPISARNERAALDALAAAAALALRRFPTTLEEDAHRLAQPDLPRRARTALLMCQGEKRVLAALLALTREATSYLHERPHELATHAREMAADGSPLADYLNGLAFEG